MTDTVRDHVRRPTRVVNTSVLRNDAREKLLGRTRYAGDLDVAGQLHARLVRSPVPSARIVAKDASAALAIPGVVAVLFGEDVPNNEIPTNTAGIKGRPLPPSWVLATDRVRYHGEPVALVVAANLRALAAGEAAVEVEYDLLPVVSDPERALEPDGPEVHEGGNLLSQWEIDRGDVDAAFADADVVVEGRYEAQVVDHAYLEPETGVGWLDDEGVINIRVSTQEIEHYRRIAHVVGLTDSKVRVQAPYLGGGFGGKEDMTVEPYIALAVQRTGRPVKMTWTRQESLTARAKRHPVRMSYRTAATADGRLLAHDIEVVSDAGAYPLLSGFVLLYITLNAAGPYRCDNVRVRSRAAYTNNTPGSAFRGFGGMQPVLGYEAQIDKVADATGRDRVEVRKRNAFTAGDRIPAGQRIDTAVWLPQCIDAVLERIGPRPEPSSPDHRVGLGLACNVQPYGRVAWMNDSASAWVGCERNGDVVVRCGVPDVGGGQVSSLAQIAAEVLHVPMDKVTVHFGDSARTPLAGRTTATRQLYMSGNAVLAAARVLRARLVEGVARGSGHAESALTLAEGGVITPDGVVPLAEVVMMCLANGVAINAMETYFAPTGPPVAQRIDAERIVPDFTFGAHAAYVEVDTRTGAVRPLRYVAAHDVGRAINPASVRGQIEGAVVQGLGYALSERIVYDEGVNLTGAFYQYAVPTAADCPEIEVVVLESGEGVGPFNARGIGEPPIGPCAATIASAIEDAVGVRPTTLPMLAERVRACIDERAQS
ncbi:xanthine dehydrogenase family protein molybdopterin-binding subunit [Nocardioides carbamazepini]|uniref:xanthine dehydrogenase family protein molybdopterin-binding subunit n=1 Tax=Nocardioides carbamazepini TaxID=2854259 RepID=UPI002149BD3D|nr:xanthine dehydrogenase family protein molybdopterin-binding subunit [Nocardioides carbamazepini]MCR1784794.1 xanthine dehydrogenase family protein molybdopterin-binding subunit [Nocardioides carbamazepini]